MSKKFVRDLVRQVEKNKMPQADFIYCNDCNDIPKMPVTGQCGHTRCYECVEIRGDCGCGVQRPTTLHVNIIIQNILEKMTISNLELIAAIVEPEDNEDGNNSINGDSRQRLRRQTLRLRRLKKEITNFVWGLRKPFPRCKRIIMAANLMYANRYFEAALHLARVVTSRPSHRAQMMLNKAAINLQMKFGLDLALTNMLKLLEIQSPTTWLTPTQLECTICFSIFNKPITTPCGHSFCRSCILKCMEYNNKCPLCLRELDFIKLTLTDETVFIKTILQSLNIYNHSVQKIEINLIPVFCIRSIVFPRIPCPLLVMDAYHWGLVRRVLGMSHARRFGLVYRQDDGSLTSIGTAVQVLNHHIRADGSSVLHTLGLYRFKVIERINIDGIRIARFEHLIDETPCPLTINRIMDEHVFCRFVDKASRWLRSLEVETFQTINKAYGMPPRLASIHSPDISKFSSWLWWVIAVLPIREDIKLLLLATSDVIKRMMAVSRVLEELCD